MRRRVKITGIGPVTPAGIGKEEFFKGINESVSHVRAIRRFDEELGAFIGAEIKNFDLRDYAPDENPRRLSRHTQFALVGAMLALADANMTPEEAVKLNPIIGTGTSIMDLDKVGRSVLAVERKGARYAMGSTVYESSSITVSGKIASYLGAGGVGLRMFGHQSACCSGLDAIGRAADLVASGQTDLAITGGAEAPLTLHPLAEFNSVELSPSHNEAPEKACRPFDMWRSTGVLGEGAAIMLLEPESSPRPAYAWVTGYGYANDSYNIPAAGISEAVRDALVNACRRPADVDYICTWGTGHRLIDAYEAMALRSQFGERLMEIPAASIKGSIGIALGASGAIQTASVALSMKHGIIPPTVNWNTPDPSCPLNLSNSYRRITPTVAIVTAHGLAGSNAAVVIENSCPP
jgi:3-oxoacyl-[acyl-carrier-protein] synthase II